MNRVVVIFNGQYINIPGDHLEEDDHFLRIYSGENFVGMFDIAVVDVAYISEKKCEK